MANQAKSVCASASNNIGSFSQDTNLLAA